MRTLVAAVAACSIFVVLSHAQSAQAVIKTAVSIPAQDLATALQAFAEERKLYLIYAYGDVKALRTPGVRGQLTQDEALARLLSGTGLTFQYLDERTLSILPIATAPATPSSSHRPPGESAPSEEELRLAQAPQSEATPAARATTEEAATVALTEILVTAQKREQRLQDVPISIDVLSGEDLDRSSARSLTDVLEQVGGVSLIEDRPGKVRLSVRGVVSPYLNVGTSPVGYYLDEIPFTFISRGELPDTNAFDLDRVEVLRGPQGTLYGVAALSGVVRVLTNDANLDEFEAKARARFSETDHGGNDYNGDLAVNVPLIPGRLAIRGVASYSDVSGFIDSTADGSRGINDLKAQSYRFKVGYRPSESLTFKLGLSRSVIENGAPSIAFEDLTTPNVGDQPDERVYDTYNLIAEYSWPSVSLISSTAYLDYRTDTRYQIAPGFGFSELIKLRSFSQEVRLASKLSGPWQWSAGALYKDATEPFIQLAEDFGFPEPYANAAVSESYAVFADATRSLADGKFEVTGGVRYFEDRLETPTTSNLGFPIPQTQRADFDRLTGRLVLAYKPQATRMFYGSVATGFRSGSTLDAAFAETTASMPPLAPDSLITYEAGMKGASSGGAFSYETVVYYTDWKDIQQLIITSMSLSTGVNAGRAVGPGVDVTLGFQPSPALTLRAALGWNDLKFDEDVFLIETDGGFGESLFARKGTRLNNSPEWTGSVGGTYRMATPMRGLHAVFAGSLIYRSSIEQRFLLGLDPLVIERTVSGIQRVLNLSIGLEGDRWSAQVFADNALNAQEPIMPAYDVFNIYQRPRTVGLQVAFEY